MARMREEKVLVRARFDAKLPTYWMLGTLLTLTLCVIGIPFVPIWLVLGWGVHRRQYEVMECELTERSLNIRRGFLFRVEKNIPLDKIQDVGLKEGPLLRRLGLSALAVETAGQSAAQGAGDAVLTGVVDAPAFRDAILNQRDIVVGLAGPAAAVERRTPDEGLLVEIRDSLRRIEGLLARANRGG